MRPKRATTTATALLLLGLVVAPGAGADHTDLPPCSDATVEAIYVAEAGAYARGVSDGVEVWSETNVLDGLQVTACEADGVAYDADTYEGEATVSDSQETVAELLKDCGLVCVL